MYVAYFRVYKNQGSVHLPRITYTLLMNVNKWRRIRALQKRRVRSLTIKWLASKSSGETFRANMKPKFLSKVASLISTCKELNWTTTTTWKQIIIQGISPNSWLWAFWPISVLRTFQPPFFNFISESKAYRCACALEGYASWHIHHFKLGPYFSQYIFQNYLFMLLWCRLFRNINGNCIVANAYA